MICRRGGIVRCFAPIAVLPWPALLRYSLKLAFVALQLVWMLAILPGHVRGMIVFGGEQSLHTTGTNGNDSCCVKVQPSCCDTDSAPKPGQPPSQERKSRCAVCYQAHGYTLPPVFDIDLAPTGLLELRRLIEPTKLHRLLCRPTYFANGPPTA